jgi:hypothetical protein
MVLPFFLFAGMLRQPKKYLDLIEEARNEEWGIDLIREVERNHQFGAILEKNHIP